MKGTGGVHGFGRDAREVEKGRRRTRHHPRIRLEQTAFDNGGLELTPGSSSGGRGGDRHGLGGREGGRGRRGEGGGWLLLVKGLRQGAVSGVCAPVGKEMRIRGCAVGTGCDFLPIHGWV